MAYDESEFRKKNSLEYITMEKSRDAPIIGIDCYLLCIMMVLDTEIIIFL